MVYHSKTLRSYDSATLQARIGQLEPTLNPQGRGARRKPYELYCDDEASKSLRFWDRLIVSAGKNEGSTDSNTLVKPKQDSKTKKPPMYKVILLNDDFTPMEFVILVLKKFFHKSSAEAEKVMLEVHNKGAGIAGVYPYEVAETKVYLVNELAKSEHHPLKSILEAEGE